MYSTALLYSIFLCVWVVLFTGLGCSEPSSSSGTPAGSQTQTETNDPKTEQKSDKKSDDQNTDSGEDEVAQITETQARSIMEASCMAASCHADVDVIYNSPIILSQLEDEIMPPTDQGRYTLSDKRRAELVLFFKGQ